MWVKNDAANPTHSFKDRVVSVAVAPRPRARLRGARLRLDRQPRQLGRRPRPPRWACESYVFIPADLEEQKILATGVYGTNLVKVRGNYDDVNRLCTELSRRARAGRSSTSTCARTTPRAPRPSPTRSPSSSAGQPPDRVVAPIASGSLFTKIAKGFDEWLELGLHRRRRAGDERRAGAGLLAGRDRLRGGHDVCRPVKPDTIAKSLAIGNPADGPYALELARAARGGGIDAVTDDEIRAGIRLLAETTGIFTETAGGVTTATLAKLAERGDIGPDERVVLVITGEGLKTLDAVRGTFEAHEIEPDASTTFEATVEPGCAPDGGHGQAPDAAARRRRRRRRASRSTGATVGEVLDALYAQHGELRDRLSDGDGGLRRFVNVYVDGEDIRFGDGLETPVADGGEVQILPGRRRRLT